MKLDMVDLVAEIQTNEGVVFGKVTVLRHNWDESESVRDYAVRAAKTYLAHYLDRPGIRPTGPLVVRDPVFYEMEAWPTSDE